MQGVLRFLIHLFYRHINRNTSPLSMKQIYTSALLFLTILIISGCNDSENLPEYINPDNKNANIGGEKYSTRIEIPALNEDDIYLTHSTTVNGKERITYSISHNAERKHCRWVAFTFDSGNRSITWKRDNWEKTEWGGDPFQPDPELPEDYVFTKNEINQNGYVRGHLVASYDRVYSKNANEQTFYYSNISPMLSRFNTGLWSKLEQCVQGWGRNSSFCDTLYIVKGGTISNGFYKTKTNEKGLTCKTIPDYYFMALVSRYQNTYKAIGFCFPHKEYLSGQLQDYAVSIDSLESMCGIDFFCNLPDKLENTIEKKFYFSNWTGL